MADSGAGSVRNCVLSYSIVIVNTYLTGVEVTEE